MRKPFFPEALKDDKSGDSPSHGQQAVPQAQAEVLIDAKSREIELTIDVDFDNYTEQDKALLLNAIANLLKIRDSEIKIKKVQRGSTKITLEMHDDLATQLYWAVKAGELKQLGVINAELKGQAAFPETSEYPEDLSERAIEEIFLKTYSALVRIATYTLRRGRADDEIAPEALASETYLRLFKRIQKIPKDWNHFFAVAAQIMRRILIDDARVRARHKSRGNTLQVELAEEPLAVERAEGLIALSEALKRLEAVDSGLSRIVELHLVNGLTIEEIAKELSLSPNRVRRQWAFAEAWLKRELSA